MTQVKNIIIYSSHLFLKELVEQSHAYCSITQYTSFIFPKINTQTIILIDDIHPLESEINALSHLCSIIILSKSNIGSFCNPQVKYMKKPLIYPDLINLINISSSNLITIAKNIWLNVTSKTLVKLIRKEIYVSSLTNKELDLLLYILSEGNAAKSKIDILKSVFGYGDQIPTHTLETHMSRLRKKLEPEVTIANSESGYVINTKETAKK